MENVILCRYLIGDAADGDLEAVTTLDERSLIERALAACKLELSGARTQLAAKNTECEMIKQTAGKIEGRRVRALQEAHEWEKRFRESIDETKRLRAINEGVRQILGNNWFHRSLLGFLPWVKVRKLKEFLGL